MENPTPFASENPSSSELKPTITSKKRTLDAEESALVCARIDPQRSASPMLCCTEPHLSLSLCVCRR